MDELSRELQTVEQSIAEVEATISEKVADFKTQLATLQSKDAEIRSKIKEAMETSAVKKFENDFIAVTYVAPTTRTSFDSTKFKAEQPEVYGKYTKTSDVSASIRIKVKV